MSFAPDPSLYTRSLTPDRSAKLLWNFWFFTLCGSRPLTFPAKQERANICSRKIRAQFSTTIRPMCAAVVSGCRVRRHVDTSERAQINDSMFKHDDEHLENLTFLIGEYFLFMIGIKYYANAAKIVMHAKTNL